MQRNNDEIKDRLLGAWQLVSWEERHTDGTTTYPLGPDAVGQLTYTSDGRVCAQLVAAGQAPFASDDWQRASPQEMCAAWPAYFGYFGTFSIDLDRGAVVHHVQAGWFPNLAGTDQVRYFRFQDGLLVLDADTAWGTVRIVWDRVRRRKGMRPRWKK